MIDKDEIEAKSKLIDVHTVNVERDYVFGWLLNSFLGGCEFFGFLKSLNYIG